MRKIDPTQEKEVEVTVKMTLVVRKDFDVEQILYVGMKEIVDSSLGIRDFEIKKIKEL